MPLTAILRWRGSANGRVTIRLLQLNRLDRVEERQLLLDAGIIEL